MPAECRMAERATDLSSVEYTTSRGANALEHSWQSRLRVVIITDDNAFRRLCEEVITDGAVVVLDGAAFLSAHAPRTKDRPDIVIVDARAVSHIALQVRRMRRQSQTTTILVSNVRDEHDCVLLLDEGADDACMSWSASFGARVRASVRRVRAWNTDLRVAIGDVVLDREHRRVWCAGNRLHLAPREYDLLLDLFNHAPRTVAKMELSVRLWRRATAREMRTTAVYIHYLRAKLAHSSAVQIQTVRNVGYALVRAVHDHDPLLSFSPPRQAREPR